MSEAFPDTLHKGTHEIATRIGETDDFTWRLLRRGILPAFQYTPHGPWRMRESAYVAYEASLLRRNTENSGSRETCEAAQ